VWKELPQNILVGAGGGLGFLNLILWPAKKLFNGGGFSIFGRILHFWESFYLFWSHLPFRVDYLLHLKFMPGPKLQWATKVSSCNQHRIFFVIPTNTTPSPSLWRILALWLVVEFRITQPTTFNICFITNLLGSTKYNPGLSLVHWFGKGRSCLYENVIIALCMDEKRASWFSWGGMLMSGNQHKHPS
jgi:hypothetical protein